MDKLRLSLERIFQRGAFRRPLTIAQTASAGAGAVFHVKPRAGVWSVSLDGAFYGDYGAKDWAIEGVEAKARELRAKGFTVQILILSTDGAIESDEALGPF